MNQKSIDEQIHEIKHLLNILVKGQEQIKSHIWRQMENKPPFPNESDSIELQEKEAVNYIHNVLIPDLSIKEEQKGELVAQSAWIEWAVKPVIEYLKTQALIYIGKALEELKNQLIPLAVDIADYILEQLENWLLKRYEGAGYKERSIFKEKIQEKFPNSRLLTKL